MASSGSAKGSLMQQIVKQPKLAQLEKVFYEWFTGKCSEGKPMTGL